MSDNIPNCGKPRDLSHFISSSPWSAESVMAHTRSIIIASMKKGKMVIIDESGQQKFGLFSVGTSNQYCGNKGGNCNCQTGVFASYYCDGESLPVDFRLFLPKKWVDNPERCLQAGIPLDKIEHHTKPQLALDMIEQLIFEQIEFKYVLADALYGNDSHFISGLERKGLYFVCDISSDTHVYVEEPIVGVPLKKGNRGRPSFKPKVLNTSSVTVQSISDQIQEWESIDVRLTERGLKTVLAANVRVWRREDGLPVETPVRLLIIKDPAKDDVRFTFCNQMDGDFHYLVRIQSTRYWIERNFEDIKGLADMDSFRGRNWNAWHHHIVLAIIALTLITAIRMGLLKNGVWISLQEVVRIVKCHNPLHHPTAEDIVRKINSMHQLRIKMTMGNIHRGLQTVFGRYIEKIEDFIKITASLAV